MEVLVGSSFGIDRSEDKAVPVSLFSTEKSGGRIGLRRCVRTSEKTVEVPESSSSVGENSENEEEEDDAVSSQGRKWIDSLEDSLPIKRGLSNHYIGKSKSFGNLMEASNINTKDLEKGESPLNKRRRLLIANKLRRRSSLSSFSIYSKINPNSMPLLALQESDEDEDHKYKNGNDEEEDDDSSDDESSKMQEKRMKMTYNNNDGCSNRDFLVQTRSCFCLTSFQDDER